MITLNQIKKVTIESTSYCNLHCPQCARFDEHGYLNKYLVPEHLDFDKFTKNFSLSDLPNLKEIEFQGEHGDAIMHPEITKFLDYFQTVPEIMIFTNGSLRSPAWWAKLAKYPNLTVTFSVDGLQDTNHIYRINSDFDKIMANAKSFIDAGGNAIWKFLVFQHNEHQVEQAEKLSHDMGFKQFLCVPTDRNWSATGVWPVKIEGVYQYSIQRSSASKKTVKPVPIVALEKFKKIVETAPEKISPRCWLYQGRLYITYTGHVIPCCMTSGLTWQNDMSGRLWQRIVGDLDQVDIYKNNFADIINGDFFQHRLEQSFASETTIHPRCTTFCL